MLISLNETKKIWGKFEGDETKGRKKNDTYFDMMSWKNPLEYLKAELLWAVEYKSVELEINVGG